MVRQINEPVSQVSVEEVEVVIGEEPIDDSQPSEYLAEDIDDEELKEIASDLVSAYDADIQSRGDWEDTIKKGMDLLGLKLEEMQNPFPGACSAHHPLMIEAAVQFHAQALKQNHWNPKGPKLQYLCMQIMNRIYIKYSTKLQTQRLSN